MIPDKHTTSLLLLIIDVLMSSGILTRNKEGVSTRMEKDALFGSANAKSKWYFMTLSLVFSLDLSLL
jgi:hypothetical protein